MTSDRLLYFVSPCTLSSPRHENATQPTDTCPRSVALSFRAVTRLLAKKGLARGSKTTVDSYATGNERARNGAACSRPVQWGEHAVDICPRRRQRFLECSLCVARPLYAFNQGKVGSSLATLIARNHRVGPRRRCTVLRTKATHVDDPRSGILVTLAPGTASAHAGITALCLWEIGRASSLWRGIVRDLEAIRKRWR